jgi:hypothetical protein
MTQAGSEVSTLASLPCAGVDDTDVFYNYKVYRFPVAQNAANANKIRIRFELDRRLTGTSELRTFEMRNLKFRVITPNYGA